MYKAVKDENVTHSLPQRLLVLLHVEEQASKGQVPHNIGLAIVLHAQAARELLPCCVQVVLHR